MPGPISGGEIFGKRDPERQKAPLPQTEQERVVTMRVGRLYKAGYPHDYAVLMARDPSIDLHQAEDLLRLSGDLSLSLSILL